MLDFAQARRTMVDSQLRTYDVTDRALLAAMGETPRERYMPGGRESFAYIDRNITLTTPDSADPRVMLTPMVLGRLIQALEIEPNTRVLDAAAGFGYASAVMRRLGAQVTALETTEELASEARKRLAEDAQDVVVKTGSLLRGLPDEAPFDAILINGAVSDRPEALLQQLAEGGRLACLTSGDGAGRAVVYVRTGDAFGVRTVLDATAPLLAEFRPAPAFVF